MRIHNKLFSYFFLFSLLLVVLSLFLVQLGLDKGMLDYVNARESRAMTPVIEELSAHYQRYGNWQRLQGNHRFFKQVIDQALDESGFERPRVGPPPRSFKRPPRPGDGAPPSHPPPSRRGDRERPEQGRPGPPHGPGRHGLLDDERNLVVGHYKSDQDHIYLNIDTGQGVVGYLAIVKRKNVSEGYELNFVDQLNQYLLIIGIALILFTAILTLPLARHLTQSIRRITSGMNKLTQGHYDIELKENRNDELGFLSRDVNELARTLKQNQSARQRWLADVSHELRTPVAILQAHVDAMLDGIRPMDKEQLESVGEDVKQLQRLIDDLHELARSDIGTQHYRKQSIDLNEYLPDWLARHETALLERGIAIVYKAPEKDAYMHADPARLQQLFDNLLSNALKYALNATQVVVTLNVSKSAVDISLEDDGEGVDEEQLPLLFDHLYQAHKHDNKIPAGSGLGLAICRKIVEAHNGEIEPYQSTLGGLGISIHFST